MSRSPLIHALKETHCVSHEAGRFATTGSLWDYSENFPALWESLCAHEPGNGPQGHVVIVWKETPKDPDTVPITIDPYLTPLDWAAAACKVNADLRVTVLDLDPHRHQNYLSWQFYSQLNAEKISWLRVLRAGDIVDDGSAIKKFGSGSLSPADFTRQIKLNLTETTGEANHHAIANLVGPQVLLADTGHCSPHVKYLRQLMDAIGLLPKQDDETPLLKTGCSWFSHENILTQSGCNKVEMILIDDMWKHGWGEVLCRAVGAEYKLPSTNDNDWIDIGKTASGAITVKAASSPQFLSDLLKGNDQRFKFSVTGQQNPLKQILFLDLRLFAGNDAKEKSFIEKLVKLARDNFLVEENSLDRKIGTSVDIPCLPWPGFTNEELTEIEVWIKSGKRETEPHFKALTLFPRLLSLTDLSLPIVLFSSTGQRKIIELLKPYGNIITDVEKPRPFGALTDDVATQAMAQFKSAMDKTCSLLAAREKCRKAISIESPKSKRDHCTYHFEVYIDESGLVENNNFRVGGLLVGYSSELTVDNLKTHMQSINWNWFGEKRKVLIKKLCKDCLKQAFHRKKNKTLCHVCSGKSGKELCYTCFETALNIQAHKDLCKPCVGKVLDDLKAGLVDALVVPISITRYPSPKECNPLDLFSPDALDNILLELIKSILEVALFEIAPFLASNRNFSASVFVATRQRHFKSKDAQFCKELYKSSGVKLKSKIDNHDIIDENGNISKKYLGKQIPQEIYYQSLQSNSISSIVSEVFAARPSLPLTVKSAVGVTLAYKNDPPTYPFFRHAHYLADLASKDVENFFEWEPVKRSGLRIKNDRDPHFLAMLDASRRLDADESKSGRTDVAGALVQTSFAMESKTFHDSTVAKIILVKVKDALGKISGEEYLRFSRLLRDNAKLGLVPPPPRSFSASPGKKKKTQNHTTNSHRQKNDGKNVVQVRQNVSAPVLPVASLQKDVHSLVKCSDSDSSNVLHADNPQNTSAHEDTFEAEVQPQESTKAPLVSQDAMKIWAIINRQGKTGAPLVFQATAKICAYINRKGKTSFKGLLQTGIHEGKEVFISGAVAQRLEIKDATVIELSYKSNPARSGNCDFELDDTANVQIVDNSSTVVQAEKPKNAEPGLLHGNVTAVGSICYYIKVGNEQYEIIRQDSCKLGLGDTVDFCVTRNLKNGEECVEVKNVIMNTAWTTLKKGGTTSARVMREVRKHVFLVEIPCGLQGFLNTNTPIKQYAVVNVKVCVVNPAQRQLVLSLEQ